MAIYCPNCGVSLPDGVAFCDACGTPVRGQQVPAQPNPHYGQRQPTALDGAGAVACPVCGAAALPGEAFCDNCGASLMAPNQYVPTTATTAAPPQSAPAPQYTPPEYAPYSQKAASLVVTSP